MSKEFDKEVREYCERTYHVMIEGAEYAYEMGCNPQFPDPYSVQDAFTAGRALGRREMKGEFQRVVDFLEGQSRRGEVVTANTFRAAIEAIPEDK